MTKNKGEQSFGVIGSSEEIVKCPECGHRTEKVIGQQYFYLCTNEKCNTQFEYGIGRK